MKPYLVCHMASSIDGRILPGRWTPCDAYSHSTYEDLHGRLGGGSWLVGRVTGQEFAKGDAYPTRTDARFPREPWLPNRAAASYGIVVDAHGRIAWGRSDVGGDPIVVVLSEAVSDAHLAGLRDDGVGYVFGGKDDLDLAAVPTILAAELGIDRLLLEGGGHLNGAFLRAGLVDEISLMLVPAIDGSSGAPTNFDGPDVETRVLPPIRELHLLSHEMLDGGILWLRYRVVRS